MFSIIGADGKEYGPVPADKVRDWISTGRANARTRIRREGEVLWTTVGELPEFAGTPASAPAAPLPPAGGPAAAPVPPSGSIAEITAAYKARAAKVDVFGCLGRSFELWKAHLLPLVGATALMMLIQFVAGMIPFLGLLSGLLLNGVFYGGLYYYYLGKMRGEERTVGDVFAGFSRNPGNLILASLLSSLLIMAVLAPFFGPIFFAVIKALMEGGGAPPDVSGATVGMVLLGMIPVLYLGIGWIFTFALVIDKGLGAWTAMEVGRRVVTGQWFRVFAVALLGAILCCLGLIALFIGFFFTMPLLFGAILYAYEDLFGASQAPR